MPTHAPRQSRYCAVKPSTNGKGLYAFVNTRKTLEEAREDRKTVEGQSAIYLFTHGELPKFVEGDKWGTSAETRPAQ